MPILTQFRFLEKWYVIEGATKICNRNVIKILVMLVIELPCEVEGTSKNLETLNTRSIEDLPPNMLENLENNALFINHEL